MEMVCNRLSSYLPCYATAYGNSMQPVMETVLSYPRQDATAYGNGVKLPKTICNRFMQPLMETVLSYPKSLEPQHRQLRL
jgi:hypothetical protein